MTTFKKKSVPGFVKGIFAALTVATSIAASTSASHAIQVISCLEKGVGVKITGQSSGRQWNFRLEHSQVKNIDTGRSEKFRFNLNPIGPDKQFSNRRGNEVVSIVRIAGNVEMTAGNKCPKRVVEPIVDPEPDYDRLRHERHIAFCYSKYRSYREWDNSYQPYGGGPRRECRSGLL